MNPASTHFVLGYHGCDRQIAERVLAGKVLLEPSQNAWDWLGSGVYFWEANARRAYEYAVELMSVPRTTRQRVKRPAVVGAVIDLGLCLNLLDSQYVPIVRDAYDHLGVLTTEAGIALPRNSSDQDRLRRNLDCAVLETVHRLRADADFEPFDTVRAAFTEGEGIYPTAGFAAKTHIQLCVRNLASIKGYFRPLNPTGRPARFDR